jgi:hypothetical protein
MIPIRRKDIVWQKSHLIWTSFQSCCRIMTNSYDLKTSCEKSSVNVKRSIFLKDVQIRQLFSYQISLFWMDFSKEVHSQKISGERKSSVILPLHFRILVSHQNDSLYFLWPILCTHEKEFICPLIVTIEMSNSWIEIRTGYFKIYLKFWIRSQIIINNAILA